MNPLVTKINPTIMNTMVSIPQPSPQLIIIIYGGYVVI